jgi:hypothetical protein
MYIPSLPLPLLPPTPPHLHQKRQTEVSRHSDSLIPHVDNKVALMVGGESFPTLSSRGQNRSDNAVPPVGLAVAAILALLLGGLIKRFRLRRSRSKAEPSPCETQTATRQLSFSQPSRPSNATSDVSESTLCNDPPVDSPKELNCHIPPPPSVLAKSQTLVPPLGSRPTSTLSFRLLSHSIPSKPSVPSVGSP